MRLMICKAKLHRLTVTQAELNYEGSITIDEELINAAGILPFEKVQVVNINNGARLETYVYAGEPGSRIVCINGAARLAQVGDKIIVIAYCDMEAEEARQHQPTLVLVNEQNDVKEVIHQSPLPVSQDGLAHEW